MTNNLSHYDTNADLFHVDTKTGGLATSSAAMSRHSDGAPQKDVWRKRLLSFSRWNKPKRGLFLLLVFAGNVLVATLAWVIVRLISG